MSPSTELTFTRTLSDVREQVSCDDSGKWDALVRARDITLQHGRLHLPQSASTASETYDGDTGLTLSPWAASQACQKLGIPSGYFKKCPPDLQDRQFNHWTRYREMVNGLTKGDREIERDGNWMLRTKGSTVRGVLSPQYAKLDNRQLLDGLLPLIAGSRYQVGLSQLTGESFHLRLVDPTIARDVLPGDRLIVGIHLSNSEVGLRACTVDALVYRVVCTNGLIRRVNNRSLLKQRHIHVSEPRFAEMLADALREAVVVAAGFIEQMALAVRTPVPDVESAITVLGQMWNLTQETQAFIRFALHGEAKPETMYGLVNAITSAAQKLPVDDRFDLETLAGILIDTGSSRAADTALRNRLLSPASTKKETTDQTNRAGKEAVTR